MGRPVLIVSEEMLNDFCRLAPYVPLVRVTALPLDMLVTEGHEGDAAEVD